MLCKESEATLSMLLETIPIPVFYKDRQGQYLGFNKAFETFFGKSKEHLIGKAVFNISPAELPKSIMAGYRALRKIQVSRYTIRRFRTRAGVMPT